MIYRKAQAVFLGWLRALTLRLAQFVGMDLLKPGCRQIPADHLSFDPALAAAFRSADRAIAYAVLAQWTESNARRDKRDCFRDGQWWTLPRTQRWWLTQVPWLSSRSWKRATDDLAAAGLLRIEKLRGQIVYAAVAYGTQTTRQIGLLDGQTCVVSRQIIQSDRQFADQNLYSESAFQRIWKRIKTTTTPAKAAVAVFPNPSWGKEVFQIPEIPDAKAAAVAEAADKQEVPPRPHRRARLPDRPAPPPKPATGETTEHDPDGDTSDVLESTQNDAARDGEEALEQFFSGMARQEVRALVRRHGAPRIREVIEQVRKQENVRNPPGLTLKLLANEARERWQWPGSSATSYSGGAYADFIQS